MDYGNDEQRRHAEKDAVSCSDICEADHFARWPLLLALVIFFGPGCQSQRAIKTPMDAIHDLAPGDVAERILLIMLPGARDLPQDLVQQGFVRAIRARNLPVDVIAVDGHLGYYLEQQITSRLSDDIIAPARAKGYRRIWLAGISLGGMGSLLYARARPGEIEGLILLAPYLGNRGLVAQVTEAGGFAEWRPESALLPTPGDSFADEVAMLAWLKDYRHDVAGVPKIYLGYGANDRFAPASRLLAQRLPNERVEAIAGGHDWATWIALWNRLLDRGIFIHRPGEADKTIAGHRDTDF